MWTHSYKYYQNWKDYFKELHENVFTKEITELKKDFPVPEYKGYHEVDLTDKSQLYFPMAGVRKEDITVTQKTKSDNTVSFNVKGETGDFRYDYSVSWPYFVPTKVTANYENGILMLTLIKPTPAESKEKEVKIQID